MDIFRGHLLSLPHQVAMVIAYRFSPATLSGMNLAQNDSGVDQLDYEYGFLQKTHISPSKLPKLKYGAPFTEPIHPFPSRKR